MSQSYSEKKIWAVNENWTHELSDTSWNALPPVIHLEIESTESWDSLGQLSMSPRPTIVSPRAKNLI